LLDTNWGWNREYRAKTRAQRQGDFTKKSNIYFSKLVVQLWCTCGAANLAIIMYTRLQLRLCYRVLNGVLLDTNWGWNRDYRAKTRAQRQGDFTKNSNNYFSKLVVQLWCSKFGNHNIYTRLQLRLCYRVLNGVTGYYYS